MSYFIMPQFDSDDRGSGRLATWQPPPPAPIAPLPPHQGTITPASFMAGLAELQQAMAQNTAALAQHQAALAQWQPPAPIAPLPQAQPQQWQAPQHYQQHYQPQPWQGWQPPAPAPAPQISTTISPVILVDASSTRSHQDNGGGGWWGLALAALFFLPLSIALAGGGR